MRGDSDLAEALAGSGGVFGSVGGADGECAPSRSCGQSPACVAVSSPALLSSAAAPSPTAAIDCVGDSVAALSELTACNAGAGTDCRAALEDGLDALCL